MTFLKGHRKGVKGGTERVNKLLLNKVRIFDWIDGGIGSFCLYKYVS